MTTPRTIAELRKALPGWSVMRDQMINADTGKPIEGLYTLTVVKTYSILDITETSIDVNVYDSWALCRRRAIAAAYAAARAVEKDI